ncbi:MAG: hypothetical protein JRC92_06380 [Deltaproteobacteria bacterium]|nr:hypothetical protein [Deltaproteobacteria bacterium]
MEDIITKILPSIIIVVGLIIYRYRRYLATLFKDSEVVEALAILDEAKNKFGMGFSASSAFDLVRAQVEKIIRSDTKLFLEVVRKGRSVRKYIYYAITYTSGDMLESGQYHVYRGVLSMNGNGLLEIFDGAIDELVKLGGMDKEYAKKEKNAIRQNIKGVG